MITKARAAVAVMSALFALLIPVVAFAATTPTLNQTINAGSLSADILQSDDTTPVASPTVAFAALNRAFTCQTSTATLGDASDKVNITNLASNNGWTLAIAATGGAAATWTAGGNTYKYNDTTGSGCTNGQMTVDPSVATVTTDCNAVCNAVTITKGSSTAYVSGTANSVTLASASSGAAWKGYLTGISFSQKIPASQASGSYSLGMTMTVTAQ